MQEGFLTDLKTVELFFRYCLRYKVNDIKERTLVMRRITAKKKAKYIRDASVLLNNKNILHIKGFNNEG